MRFLTRLAAILLGLVGIMFLVWTFQPALIPGWEEPLVRYRVLLVSLPMVAFFIALEAARLQTGRPDLSCGDTLAGRSQPIPTTPSESGFAVPVAEVIKEDGTVTAKLKRKLSVRAALTISVLLGVPLAVLMALCAVSLFVPWWPENRSMIGWAARWVGTPLASFMAHGLIFRDVLRRKGIEAAMLTAVLLTPMITFAISYQACWLWLRLVWQVTIAAR
jgi:hypothetical protein